MHGKIIVLLLTAAASHGICAGEIYRCTAANGDVMYTNLACPTTSQIQRVASYVPEKDSPPPVRDLAAEAAALSAQQAREAAEQAQAAVLPGGIPNGKHCTLLRRQHLLSGVVRRIPFPALAS
jgi:hypothetical protein